MKVGCHPSGSLAYQLSRSLAYLRASVLTKPPPRTLETALFCPGRSPILGPTCSRTKWSSKWCALA